MLASSHSGLFSRKPSGFSLALMDSKGSLGSNSPISNERNPMKKATLLKITNITIALFFVTMAITGLFGEALDDQTVMLHTKAGYVFIAIIVLHVILNWSWVKVTFFKKKAVPVARSAQIIK